MTQLEITDIGTDNENEEVSEEDAGGQMFAAVVTGETRSGQEESLRQVLAAADTVAGAGIGATARDKTVREILNREVELPVSVGTGRVACGPSPDSVRIDGAIDALVSHPEPHLIVDSFASLGESPGVIADRVREAVDGGVEVHVVSEGFDITDENVDAVLGVLDGLDSAGLELQRRVDARDIQRWLPETVCAGRPPLGFENKDGERVPADNIDEVRAVLSMVVSGELSKRKAGERLDVSTRTIDRALDNLDRYGLDEDTGE